MAFSRSSRLKLLLVLDGLFFLTELVVGLKVGSLALVSDSFHMLTDVLSLIISQTAIKLVSRPTSSMSKRFTYGMRRAEVLAGLANGIFLISLSFSMMLQSIERLCEPTTVSDPKLVVIVGSLGLVSNVLGFLLCHEHAHSHAEASPDSTEANNETRQHGGSANMFALMLHILGDTLANISVIISGLIIWLTDVSWRFRVDPIASMAIALIMLLPTIPFVKRSCTVFLQAAPSQSMVEDIRKSLYEVEGVLNVHELHVWQLSEGQLVATVHVTIAQNKDTMDIASAIQSNIRSRGVSCVTIQCDYPNKCSSDVKTE